MRDRAFFLEQSRVFTHELHESHMEPWPACRAALQERGIGIEAARVVERIDAGDYLDYILIVSGDDRVFVSHVSYEPDGDTEITLWRDISGSFEQNPHAQAIQAVLSA